MALSWFENIVTTAVAQAIAAIKADPAWGGSKSKQYVPTPIPDGVNKTFMFAVPFDPLFLLMFQNGTLLLGSDYTIVDSSTIMFAVAPVGGSQPDKISGVY